MKTSKKRPRRFAALPFDFTAYLRLSLHNDIVDRARDGIHDAAAAIEARLTQRLQGLAPGDDLFEGAKAVGPGRTADSVLILLRKADVPLLKREQNTPGEFKATVVSDFVLKLARATAEIERRVNLTDGSKPAITLLDVPAFAWQIFAQGGDNWSVSVGAGRDRAVTPAFEQALARLSWNRPPLQLDGYMAASSQDGFLISLFTSTGSPIPLGIAGLSLQGVGVNYGEGFVPKFKEVLTDDVVGYLNQASIGEWYEWSKKNALEKWTPVAQKIKLFGISTMIGDLPTSGGLLRLSDAGISYLSYGPTFIWGGHLEVLRSLDFFDLVGVLDLKRQRAMASGQLHLDIFENWGAKGAVTVNGGVEISTPLLPLGGSIDDFYVAVGNYDMAGANVKVLDILQLYGGYRVTFSSIAARGGCKVTSKGGVFGVGGGYELSLDLLGVLGWNPAQLEADLKASGSLWLKLFGATWSAGLDIHTYLRVPKPLEFRLDGSISISLAWPLHGFTVSGTLFSLPFSGQVNAPLPAIQVPKGGDYALGTVHPISGRASTLQPTGGEILPDTEFAIPFQRIAQVPSSLCVNAIADDGYVDEAGVGVNHRLERLEIYKIDEATGREDVVPNLQFAWKGIASADGFVRSTELHFPANDPLSCTSRFDYALPPTPSARQTTELEYFGVGNDLTFPVDAGSGRASLSRNRLRIESDTEIRLINDSAITALGRGLTCQHLWLSVTSGHDGAPVEVHRFVLRILSAMSIRCDAFGDMAKLVEVQGSAYGAFKEFECTVTPGAGRSFRQAQLRFSTESSLLIIAVGFSLADGGSIPNSKTVLSRGKYALYIAGTSRASFGGTSASAAWERLRFEFLVKAPIDLRPYIRYSTVGDERDFGMTSAFWNPTPRGIGFPHYSDCSAVVRFKASYMSAIFTTVSVGVDRQPPTLAVPIKNCSDGSIAVPKAAAEWIVAHGGTGPLEQEIVFPMTGPSGMRSIQLYCDTAGDGHLVKVDEWQFLVSAFRNPKELLAAPGSIVRSFGPFGTRLEPAQSAVPVPTIDPSTIASASLELAWTLPAWMAAMSSANAGAELHFLRLVESCGYFDAHTVAREDYLCEPCEQTEICALFGRDTRPIAFLIRTPEPCDWRRVAVSAQYGVASPTDSRFDSVVVPNSDGCCAIVMLRASGVFVRVPRGKFWLRFEYRLEVAGIPSLVNAANPSKKVFTIDVTFVQPHGTSY